tara:strand:+ start:9944 stop:10471 length:528 start_codon:yes stop_codon:yes gene_type:complete
MNFLICANPVSNLPVDGTEVRWNVVGLVSTFVGELDRLAMGVRRQAGVDADVGAVCDANGSMYAVGLVAAVGFAAGIENMTGVVVGLAIRGPEGRSQGQRDVSVRFGDVFFDSSANLVFAGPFSLLASSLGVAPARSLLLYPKIESPSTELWRVKFGIDLAGLGEREVCVGEVTG